MPRGGTRPGAGRPRGGNRAAEILASVDEVGKWIELLRCPNATVRRRARNYLANRHHDANARKALETARLWPGVTRVTGETPPARV
jgi:hypothetical protein